MAADDVVCGAVPGDCGRYEARTTSDGFRERRRPRASPPPPPPLSVDVSSGRSLMRPDGTSWRLPGVATTKIHQSSSKTLSTSTLPGDRTLLGNSDAAALEASHPPLLLNCVRFAEAGDGGGSRIWQSDAVGNSIHRRSVSVRLLRRRHHYARSRRRRRRLRLPVVGSHSSATGVPTAGGLVASLLTIAVLLAGSVAADPRRFHGDSQSASSQQLVLAAAASSHGTDESRRSRSDNIGAGIPCTYEGHIKTDRYTFLLNDMMSLK